MLIITLPRTSLMCNNNNNESISLLFLFPFVFRSGEEGVRHSNTFDGFGWNRWNQKCMNLFRFWFCFIVSELFSVCHRNRIDDDGDDWPLCFGSISLNQYFKQEMIDWWDRIPFPILTHTSPSTHPIFVYTFLSFDFRIHHLFFSFLVFVLFWCSQVVAVYITWRYRNLHDPHDLPARAVFPFSDYQY